MAFRRYRSRYYRRYPYRGYRRRGYYPRRRFYGRRKMGYGRRYTRSYARGWANNPAIERKFKDTDAAATSISTNGQLKHLNAVAQGDSINQRIGRKYRIVSIDFNADIWLEKDNPTMGTDNSALAIMYAIVWDKQSNGSTPNWSDIFANQDTSTQTNLDNRQRFLILKRWNITMRNPSGQTGADMRHIQWYKNCSLTTVNNGTASTAAAIQTGTLWLCRIAQGNQAASNTVDDNASIRIRFIDP